MSEVSFPISVKKSGACICGRRKLMGAPFCASCWNSVTLAQRDHLRSRDSYDAAFIAICETLQAAGAIPASINLTPPIGAPPPIGEKPAFLELSPAKALAMIALSEVELDRVFSSASLEQKCVAIRALLCWDPHRV